MKSSFALSFPVSISSKFKNFSDATGRSALHLAYRLAGLKREMENRLRFGPAAPKYAERIWLCPFDCRRAVSRHVKNISLSWSRYGSARVVEIWPEASSNVFVALGDRESILSCYDHWVRKIPWQETVEFGLLAGEIARLGSAHDCKNLPEVMNRYETLDRMFLQIQKEGKIRTRKELNPRNFREENGILIHIGPSGEPIVGDGFHRMAMALILNLPLIPAQIGCVYKDAIPFLQRFRQPNPVPNTATDT